MISGAFYPPSEIIRGHHLLEVNKIHLLLVSTEDKTKLVQRLGELIDAQRDCYGLKSMDDYKGVITESSRFDNREIVFFKRMIQHILPEEACNMFAGIMFEDLKNLQDLVRRLFQKNST